jgi:hypothetical protein
MSRTAQVLTFLNIPFKNTFHFWIDNEAELDYIYDDFIRESKKLKCRLHPDNGGDEESFSRFNKFCLMALSSFCAHGIGRVSIFNLLEQRKNAAERVNAKREFNRKQRHGARH